MLVLVFIPISAAYLGTCGGNSDYARYGCAIDKAMSANDSNYCESLGKFEGYCYYHFGVQNINPNFCEKAIVFSHDCFYNISFLTGNPSYCAKSGQRDDCVYKMVYTFDNIDWCELYSNPQICYEKIYEMNPTKQNCKYLNNKPEDCVCKKDEYLERGKCYPLICPDYQHPSNHKCINICKDWQTFVNGTCFADCPIGYVSASNGNLCAITFKHFLEIGFKVVLYLLVIVFSVAVLYFMSIFLNFLANSYIIPFMTYIRVRLDFRIFPLIMFLFFLYLFIFAYFGLLNVPRGHFERCTGISQIDCVDSAEYNSEYGRIDVWLENAVSNFTLISDSASRTDDCVGDKNDQQPSYFQISRDLGKPLNRSRLSYVSSFNETIHEHERFVLSFPCDNVADQYSRIKTDLSFNISHQNNTKRITITVRTYNKENYDMRRAQEQSRDSFHAFMLFALLSLILIVPYLTIFRIKKPLWRLLALIRISRTKLILFFIFLCVFTILVFFTLFKCYPYAYCGVGSILSHIFFAPLGLPFFWTVLLNSDLGFFTVPVASLTVATYLYLFSCILHVLFRKGE